MTVHAALRSDAPLVVIEAPAGCGKTHQGADYAREIAAAGRSGGPLILTHTHAACSVFAERTKGSAAHVEIRTIDSIIAQIAAAYHAGLGLPPDTAAWVRQREDEYAELALKVAALVACHPMIASSLAHRHPTVICDEHQDSSGDQHSLVMALLDRGARLRIFADPMQRIFPKKKLAGARPPYEWSDLKGRAQAFERLDFPHRWQKGCSRLGEWTLDARTALESGRQVDVRGAPKSVAVAVAENVAQARLDYRLSKDERKPVDDFEKVQDSLLILTRHNETARSFCGLFNRRIPLWEGHTRYGLEKLVNAMNSGNGDPCALAAAVVTFMDEIGKGFSASAFGNALEQEVREGCARQRKGKPAAIQELARCLLDDPSHRGVARALRRLSEFRASDPAFAEIEMDHYREYRDAIRLGEFERVDDGLAEITHRRTYARPRPPDKAISTIHKAKGLECESVIVMPCDAKTFPDKLEARCLLYVALTRARSRLMLVVPQSNPSPLLIL